jgi:hypothetical protein
VAFGEANIFESELQLVEPLCIVIMHVLATTRNTMTEIPEHHLFRKLHMLLFFSCCTSKKIVEYVEVPLAQGGTCYPRLKHNW